MSIKFQCSKCKTILEAETNLAGNRGSCPKCGNIITIPRDESSGQPEPKEEAKKD
jgi:hypothetical protein